MSMSELPTRADASFTVDGFCQAENISRGKLYEFWRKGCGPRFYWNGAHRRITQAARLDWQREREAAATLDALVEIADGK